MAKTLPARTAIKAELERLCGRVFFDHAEFTGKPVYPYLIFMLEEVSYSDGMTLCELEVNAVDYGKSTSRCESLCDEVQRAFRGFLHLDDEIEFAAYQDRRQTVPEEDRNIIRRRMTFEVRLHERS